MADKPTGFAVGNQDPNKRGLWLATAGDNEARDFKRDPEPTKFTDHKGSGWSVGGGKERATGKD
jgi:hypothetical protein